MPLLGGLLSRLFTRPAADQTSEDASAAQVTRIEDHMHLGGQLAVVCGTANSISSTKLDALLCFLENRACASVLTEALVWNVAQWLTKGKFYQPETFSKSHVTADGNSASRQNAQGTWATAVVLTGGPQEPLGHSTRGRRWFAFTIAERQDRWMGGVELGLVDRIPTVEPNANLQEIGTLWCLGPTGVWYQNRDKTPSFAPATLDVGDRVCTEVTTSGDVEVK
eukprot:TRINITY_DN55776_c0_g1_i1.p1 TRINITY_DN55776_c0_g1~~TRINITY_DN55776_c0_g1_i1.p1  ORF type:complete len:230 (-),score=35.87 TRINITY_DN55776_c0_g1_i1:178-846(-)